LHNNSGWARHDAGDYAGALTEFEAALTAYSVHGTPEQQRVARWAVARALRSLARFDEALDIQLRLHEQGPDDGYVEEELAELLLATGHRAGAAEHAAVAARLLGADSWFAEYESGRLDRLRQLARDG
jgi:tetratricopeptide (TPR) repeat protein